MKANRTFVLTNVVGMALILGFAAIIRHSEKDGPVTSTASGDRMVRVWDTQSGKLMTDISQSRRIVSSVWFSPDGQQLVTKSEDGARRIWDLQSGNPVAEALNRRGVVTSAQFSPDGKQIITSSQDSTVRVWKAEKPTHETPASGSH